MRKGDIGADVATLQRQLRAAGFRIAADGWFGDATERALIDLQRRAGLVADGIAGPKTRAALANRNRDPRRLSEAHLEAAAARLGIQLAALKAVNAVESRGTGFLDDHRPVILYERHIAWRLLGEIDPDKAAAFVQRYPNLINPKRGGYAGGSGEWARLASAVQIIDRAIAYGACSWGQFQIMGYHAVDLGYDSVDAFVLAMHASEAAQLDAFVRYIEAHPPLHKALKARKWAEFARGYNGPAYQDNAYDKRLAIAYERHVRLADPPPETP